MDIIVTAKDFDLTPSLNTYVEEKISKLGKFWDKIIRVRVELSVDHGHVSGELYHVDVLVEVPGPDIRASEQASDMHAAIDLVIPILERQIDRIKGKQASSKRQLRRAKDAFYDFYQSFKGK